MSFWTFRNLRAASGGSWLQRPPSGEPEDPVVGLSIDTRTITPGRVFVALQGERFDGHDFLADGCMAGAPLLIIDRPAAASVIAGEHPEVGVLLVKNTRATLARLAAAYRRTLETTRVIAVTGSNGKTTTTRLIDRVLSTRFRGTASVKSFNNDIGVPLTILAARPGDQYLVCEVGTSNPGEIAGLARIVEPDIAVITSIGRAHIENLGSMEAIAREKASLLSYIRPGGMAVVTADSGDLREWIKPIPNIVTFGRAEDADLRLTSFEHIESSTEPRSEFTINERTTFPLALYGQHNAYNALAAVAVGRRFGVDDEEIRGALASVPSEAMRLQRETIDGIDVFNDAYNASPESMVAAITTFGQLTSGAQRRVVIVGDMLELGDEAAGAHREVAECILRTGTIDLVVTIGAASLHTAERLAREWAPDRVLMCSHLDDAQAARIVSMTRPGDAVLVKGSRAMRLERIPDTLRARHAAADASSLQ
ncbi:MAG: UDP-N-acetylmuramoyl-tripeptide--D-alanyl-D-alanine ligase [Phycisphaerales bacterium]